MVRRYRKKDHKFIDDISTSKLSKREIINKFKISKYLLKKYGRYELLENVKKVPGPQPILNAEEEKFLYNVVKKLHRSGFCVTRYFIRKYAFMLALSKSYVELHKYPQQVFGIDWYWNFLKRNCEFKIENLQKKMQKTTFLQQILTYIEKYEICGKNVFICTTKFKIDVSQIFSNTHDNTINIVLYANITNLKLMPIFLFPMKLNAFYDKKIALHNVLFEVNNNILTTCYQYLQKTVCSSKFVLIIQDYEEYIYDLHFLSQFSDITTESNIFLVPKHLNDKFKVFQNCISNVKSEFENVVEKLILEKNAFSMNKILGLIIDNVVAQCGTKTIENFLCC